jgi:hypothetical protein
MNYAFLEWDGSSSRYFDDGNLKHHPPQSLFYCSSCKQVIDLLYEPQFEG